MANRVVFIGPCYPFKGGVSKYAARLAVRLAATIPLEMHTYARLYPRWLFPGRSEPDPILEYNDVPFAIRDLSFLRPWTFYRLGCRIRRDAGSIDGVVLTWWTSVWGLHSWLLMMGLRKSVPLVLWCHNVFDHGRRGLLTIPVKQLLQGADSFVTHSGTERKRLESLAGGRPVGMSPLPPLHLGELKPLGEPGVMAPSRDRLREAPFRLLFFGFVRPYKGVEDLLEAMRQVSDKVHVHLTICGECWGKMHQKLQACLREYNIEDIVDIRDAYIPDDQLGAVFEACDAVVLPYREATGSGVVALAHFFSRPAIVTDVGSLSEAVVPGRNGWVCRAGNPDHLSLTILQAINQPISAASVAAAQPDAVDAWDKLTACVLQVMVSKTDKANAVRQEIKRGKHHQRH
ncbi:MAG TPA: hypothetical protein DCS43_16135 [Verrucomicrobia bacterium]|nr:hypothetical protein [Verrucomicrobiota bacterium]